MKSTIGLIILVSMLGFFPPPAMARDFCFNAGSELVIFKSFAVPAKGICKPIIAVIPSAPGFVASGGGCTTSDGKTLLFTMSAGLSVGLETIQGAIDLAAKTGTSNACEAPAGLATTCSGASITVETCAKKAPPITAGPSNDQTSQGSTLP